MTYDFLIIGGGVAGASAAYELAPHGSVLLLEGEDTAGYHATGIPAALFARCYGGPVVRQINAASAVFFRTPPAGFTQTQLLTPRGCLAVAQSDDASDLDALIAQSETGEEVTGIETDAACDMAALLRPDRVNRAIFKANVSDIDVVALHLSYLKGARARGAVILVKQAVSGLTRTGEIWVVHTVKGNHKAMTVINAAGAWADQIEAMAGARPIGLTPKRRTAIIVKPPTDTNCATLPAVDFAGSDAYLKPEGGMLMALPEDAKPVEGHDAWADDMNNAVRADWVERETTIKIDKIEHSWAGLRSFVADEAPVVGSDIEAAKFFWLAGPGGYGNMMALAVLAGDLITAGRPGAPSEKFAQALSPRRLL